MSLSLSIDVQEARQRLLAEAVCWQVNAAHHYAMADEMRERWRDGLESSAYGWRHHMPIAKAFADQARCILLALA
jgi:hypothetical protein